MVDIDKADRWSARGTSYEAGLSFKPAPSFTLDIGKARQNWGKGYVWNPVAFVDRPKNPDDPTLAQEGYVVVALSGGAGRVESVWICRGPSFPVSRSMAKSRSFRATRRRR